MEAFIWIGAGATVLGFVGVLWSILLVRRARSESTGDDDLRARLQRIIPLNIGSLTLSLMGLALVVTGILLG